MVILLGAISHFFRILTLILLKWLVWGEFPHFLSTTPRDGFRQRGALGRLSVWGPAQVWPIWPFVWKVCPSYV